MKYLLLCIALCQVSIALQAAHGAGQKNPERPVTYYSTFLTNREKRAPVARGWLFADAPSVQASSIQEAPTNVPADASTVLAAAARPVTPVQQTPSLAPIEQAEPAHIERPATVDAVEPLAMLLHAAAPVVPIQQVSVSTQTEPQPVTVAPIVAVVTAIKPIPRVSAYTQTELRIPAAVANKSSCTMSKLACGHTICSCELALIATQLSAQPKQSVVQPVGTGTVTNINPLRHVFAFGPPAKTEQRFYESDKHSIMLAINGLERPLYVAAKRKAENAGLHLEDLLLAHPTWHDLHLQQRPIAQRELVRRSLERYVLALK